jgi:uncharacterized protein (UPF0333 family)
MNKKMMNKELKLLLISMVLMFVVTIALYLIQNYECTTSEYQDLNGPHSVTKCEKNG